MIYSFLKNNPWFKGDIVLICKDLPDEMVKDFNSFGNIKIIEPSQVLLQKADMITDKLPKFKDISVRFFSLEIFRLQGYNKVLFLDSDMVVVKSIEEIFKLPGLFYASAQLCYYKGKGRNNETFIAEMKSDDNTEIIESPINTGFLLLDGEILTQNHYQKLIESIRPALWKKNDLTYTDELIINQYFKGKINMIDTRYNYRARAARIMKEREGFAFEDAKIIHFYSKYKPWNFDEVLASSSRNLNWIKAYSLWFSYYVEFLKFYHLQKKIDVSTNCKIKKVRG